jgi:predicted RNA-binding protein with TRAM domain
MKKTILLFFAVWAMTQISQATNYYVATTGSDSNNGLSWTTPFATINQAITTATTLGGNVWVKGGTYNITGVTPVANVHLYGGFAGTEASLTDRALSDKDGNGIIDPWEFTYETLLNIVNSTNSGVYISSTSMTTADKLIIDGFTITYTCTSATVPPIVVNLASNVGAITFQNNIIRNCALTGVVADGTTTAMLINSRGILKNCLFEKNIATITFTGQGATPFVTIVNSRATGCVFRNNKNTADYSTINYVSNYNAAFRGMIVHFLSGSSGAISNTSLSTSLFYNNELNCIPFKDRLDQGLNNASVVGYGIYSASYGTDSVVNCIFASNKGTLTCYQATGMYLLEQPNVHHYVLNNVFWNNYNAPAGGYRNFKVDVITSGLVANNVMNSGSTYIASTFISSTSNLTDLNISNTDATKGPKFQNPTTVYGNPTDLSAEKSDWRILTTSYLVGKGVAIPNSPTGVTPKDKSGLAFASTPAVGAYEGYEGLSAPTITGITPGDAQLSVAFTAGLAGNSAITNYKYSTDGGITFQTRQTGTTASPIVITGLANGTSYNVQIKAVNGNGDGTPTLSKAATPSATATTPGAPGITAITPTNAKLSVAFTIGSDGGSGISTYKYSTDGGATFKTRASGSTASPIDITTVSSGTGTLVNGTSYNVQIKAVNAQGDGVATATTTSTLFVVPTNVVATAGGNITAATAATAQASVSFTAPVGSNSNLLYYTVTSNPGSKTGTGSGSPIVVSGLTTNTPYTFTVAAYTAAGIGSASSASATKTTLNTDVVTAKVPNAPTNGTATVTGGQISLAFTAPNLLTGESSISSYKYSTDGGVTYLTRTDGSTTASPIVISVLSSDGTTALNGTYAISIKAVNANGDGLASTASVVTVTSAPSAPTITGITPGNGQLSVAFTVPTNTGSSAITNYKYSTDGGVTFTACSTPQTTSPIVIKGLTNGTLYFVQLKAVNTTDGAASLTSAVTPSATAYIINVSSSSLASSLTLTPVSDIVINKGIELTVNNPSTTVNSITVNGGGKLTLTGAALTLGALNLLSDATNGTGTFVDQNANGGLTVTGTSTVNQSLQAASALRTWYITPPVVATTEAPAIPTPALSIIKYFDETLNTGTSTDNWVSTTSMVAQKGYQVVPVAGNDISFSGTLNNGNQNIAITSRSGTDNYAGFNLIGNPYPSYLDWNLVTANSANTALMRSTTMWYRTQSAGAYSFWTVNGDGVTSPNGASPKIPPMQAFWVRANAGGGSLALTNAMRSHAPATDMLLKAPAAKNTSKTLVRLQVSNGTNTDEAVLYLSANASNGIDVYDAPKMSNDNVAIPEIYTTVGAEHMVINALKILPMDTPIGLGFVPGNATSFSLTTNEISNLPTGVKLILKDNVTKAETDLTDGTSAYQFNPAATSSDRFSVIFRSAGAATSVETPQDNSMLVYSNAPQQFTVVCNYLPLGSILSVYNAMGQKLVSQQLRSASTQVGGKFTPGVYVVKVNNTTKKVIIN